MEIVAVEVTAGHWTDVLWVRCGAHRDDLQSCLCDLYHPADVDSAMLFAIMVAILVIHLRRTMLSNQEVSQAKEFSVDLCFNGTADSDDLLVILISFCFFGKLSSKRSPQSQRACPP